MRAYFGTLRELLRISVLKSVQYRINFAVLFLDSALWLGISIAFFSIIYTHVPTINGWTLPQMMLLLGASDLIKSVLFAFFIQGLTKLPNLIRSGDLDSLLTKPINSQFLVSFSEFSVAQALNVLPALSLIAYAAHRLGTGLSVAGALLVLPALIAAVALSYAIWFGTMTLSVWMRNSGNLNELFISLQTMMRYPVQIYSGTASLILVFILPIGLVANVPVGLLTGHVGPGLVVYFAIASVIYLALAIGFWRFALRRYDSSGS
jgi:ABC-2 type transport system permease protein